MNDYKIITDTCSDLPKDIRNKYDIDYIPFCMFKNGVEFPASLDWTDMSSSEMYDYLLHDKKLYLLPSTENTIRQYFLKYLKMGMDVLYIAACEKQSKNVLKAQKIQKELAPQFSDNRIVIIDSLNASFGEGILAIKAAKAKNDGKTLDETAEYIKSIRKNVVQFVTVAELVYLSNADKVSSRTAAAGDLFNIKPIFVSDVNGNQAPIAKIKGREASLNKIVELFLNEIEDGNEPVIIAHGDDYKTALAVKNELEASDKNFTDIRIICMGPAVGIATGPGTIGLFGFGKEVKYIGD